MLTFFKLISNFMVAQISHLLAYVLEPKGKGDTLSSHRNLYFEVASKVSIIFVFLVMSQSSELIAKTFIFKKNKNLGNTHLINRTNKD